MADTRDFSSPAGNTVGDTAENISGNTAGNTAENTAQNATSGAAVSGALSGDVLPQATQVSGRSVEAWVQRFRLQYPMGGLVTMLAAVHAGQYIVQATLSVGGISLTSGIAEAKTLGEAEAIAQAIALERFGLEKLGLATQGLVGNGDRPVNGHAANGHATNGHLLSTPPLPDGAVAMDAPSEPEANPILEQPKTAKSKAVQPKASKVKQSKLKSAATLPESPELESSEPESSEPESPIPESPTPDPSASGLSASVLSVPESLGQTETLQTEAVAIASQASAGIVPFPDEIPDEIPDTQPPSFVADWSDDLAQIQVELKRLGWNAKQEADYLQRTYGKPSRDYITDYSELVNFLSYLRALPTHFDPGQFDDLEADGLEADDSGTDGLDADGLETGVNIPADYDRPAARPVARPFAGIPDAEIPDAKLSAPEIPEESDNQSGLSRDEMMQQTAAECQRLKWTNRQGSNFLKSRYGKPTRKDLTNHELWDFLQYLSSVAPVEESVTEKLPF